MHACERLDLGRSWLELRECVLDKFHNKKMYFSFLLLLSSLLLSLTALSHRLNRLFSLYFVRFHNFFIIFILYFFFPLYIYCEYYWFQRATPTRLTMQKFVFCIFFKFQNIASAWHGSARAFVTGEQCARWEREAICWDLVRSHTHRPCCVSTRLALYH